MARGISYNRVSSDKSLSGVSIRKPYRIKHNGVEMGVWGGCDGCKYLEMCTASDKLGLPLMCEDAYQGEYIKLTPTEKRLNVYPSNWGVNGVICQ